VQSPQQVRSEMSKMNLTLNEYRSSYGLQYSRVYFYEQIFIIQIVTV